MHAWNPCCAASAAGRCSSVVGLVLSGATALPIPTQLELAVRVLGEDLRAGGLVPDAMAAWLQTLRDGIRATEASAPFMFYGTDWLAFGHFAIAAAFVGALRDPLRNRWLFQYGMWICAAVPVWALVCGPIRGIPFLVAPGRRVVRDRGVRSDVAVRPLDPARSRRPAGRDDAPRDRRLSGDVAGGRRLDRVRARAARPAGGPAPRALHARLPRGAGARHDRRARLDRRAAGAGDSLRAARRDRRPGCVR
jgi:hypothetical protein